MNTKDIVIIVLVIAIILAAGGIFAFGFTSNGNSDDNDANITDDAPENSIDENIKNASMDEDNSSSDDVTAGLTVVKEEVVFNGQAGEGYIHEVTYSDGNFRQYDNATGELIGSSFDADQARLGNPNGVLE